MELAFVVGYFRGSHVELLNLENRPLRLVNWCVFNFLILVSFNPDHLVLVCRFIKFCVEDIFLMTSDQFLWQNLN
jgi:hypothetical protein